MNQQEWFSSQELAGLSGMPTTRSGVLRLAYKENWLARPRRKKGGGQEFHLSSLPLATQTEIVHKNGTQSLLSEIRATVKHLLDMVDEQLRRNV